MALHTEKKETKKITLLAILLAIGLVLGFFEGMLPVFGVLPGAKLGLANTVTMLVLVWFGPTEALVFGVLRATLTGIFSGTVTMAVYGGVGSVLSVLAMWFILQIAKRKVSMAGVSMMGAFFFNIGQILVAAAAVHNIQIFRYLPVLTLISTVCGLVTGVVVELVLQKEWRVGRSGRS